VRRVGARRGARILIASAIRHSEDRLVRSGVGPGHRQYRKFVIVSRARTGSNLLVSLLNSHPQVDARGELLRELRGASVEARLDHIYGRKPRRIQAVGFKLFYYHPLDDRQAPVWARLRETDELHVLHLKRRNVLRTLTSRKLASTTNVWLDRGETGPIRDKPMVRFSPDELGRAFEQNDVWEAACDREFRNHHMMGLYYEELVSHPAVLERVVEFLGVPPRQLHTSLHQQNPEHLSALITDYEELQRAFQRSRWASFFDG